MGLSLSLISFPAQGGCKRRARWGWQVSALGSRLRCLALRAALRFCSDNSFLALSAQKIFGSSRLEDRVQPAGAFTFDKSEVACLKIQKMNSITKNTPKPPKYRRSQSVTCAAACAGRELERLPATLTPQGGNVP